MDSLSRARGIIKGKLTRFETFIGKLKAKFNDSSKSITPELAIQLQDRINSSSSLLSEFEEIHAKILEVSVDVEDDNIVHAQFEDTYFEVVSRAKALLQNTGSVSNSEHVICADLEAQSLTSSRSQHTAIKLPTIQLPRYEGKLESWLEFREIFNNLIRENVSHQYSKIQSFWGSR